MFLIDRNHRNTSFVQISASLSNKYGFEKQTKGNNKKIREQNKIFIFNIFHDFIILVDREHQNTPFDQISVSLNKYPGFNGQTKKDNREIREQKKNSQFLFKQIEI